LALKTIKLARKPRKILTDPKKEVEILLIVKSMKYTITIQDAYYDLGNLELHMLMEYATPFTRYLDGYKSQKLMIGSSHVVAILKQLLRGLAEIHRASLVHRDIKADNLLVTVVDGVATLKVGDFGLTEHLKPGEHLRGAYGTKDYLAPETNNNGAYGYSVDVFAAGKVGLEISKVGCGCQYPQSPKGHWDISGMSQTCATINLDGKLHTVCRWVMGTQLGDFFEFTLRDDPGLRGSSTDLLEVSHVTS
jgi:serine/threonine protein kinase